MNGVCLYYSDNKQDAEDLLHDGFMKVFENIDKLNHSNIEAWMRRVFINIALMRYRQSKRNYTLTDDNFNDMQTESIDTDSKELMEIIMKLPQQYRLVFNLYALEGYKHKEIAEQLGISEGTSKSNLSRARKILRNQLKAIDYI